MEIVGLTFIRNGLHYDYPFRETIESLGKICSKVIVAVGDSTDGTEEVVRRYPFVEVINTTWDENLRRGGLILSQQTNLLLTEARQRHPDAWAIYLQGDEVISEQDHERIRADLLEADRTGCDALRWRYLHFWGSYRQIAYAKRWYPHEIRAIKLASPAESYGDAQSFRAFVRCFETEATVYHYGHVREKAAYERKKRDFHRWWHSDDEIPSVIKKGESRDGVEPTLSYLGPHPEVMRSRISKSESPLVQLREVWVVGDLHGLSRERAQALLNGVAVHWVSRMSEVPEDKRAQAVNLKQSFWQKLMRSRSVPQGMLSPQARPWSPEFWFRMKLSEQGISSI